VLMAAAAMIVVLMAAAMIVAAMIVGLITAAAMIVAAPTGAVTIGMATVEARTVRMTGPTVLTTAKPDRYKLERRNCSGAQALRIADIDYDVHNCRSVL